MTAPVPSTPWVSSGSSDLLDLVTEAYWSGVELAVGAGVVKARGDGEVLGVLRERRSEVIALLSGPCAGCGAPPVVWEAGTAVPWCRPCALERGRRLLALERPDLSEPEASPVPRLVASQPAPAARCVFCGAPSAPSMCCQVHELPMCEEHRYERGFYGHRAPPWLVTASDADGIDDEGDRS